MDYHNSIEKNYVRDTLVFPLFIKLVNKLKSPPIILELVDNNLEAVRKYYNVNPLSKIIGITLGDHIPELHPFTIFEGKLINILGQKEFKNSSENGFDFANLDFYGPGRFFDETKSSYDSKLFDKFFSFQKKRAEFGMVVTVDAFDCIPPRNNSHSKENMSTIELMRKKIIPHIYLFVVQKKLELHYERLLNIAGIIIQISRSANKNGFNVSIFKQPHVYIGRSGHHVSPMITIAFRCQKGAKSIEYNMINKAVMNTIFLE